MATMLHVFYLIILQHVIAGPLPSFRPSTTRQALATASANGKFASPTIMSRTSRDSVIVTRSALPVPAQFTQNSSNLTPYGFVIGASNASPNSPLTPSPSRIMHTTSTNISIAHIPLLSVSTGTPLKHSNYYNSAYRAPSLSFSRTSSRSPMFSASSPPKHTRFSSRSSLFRSIDPVTPVRIVSSSAFTSYTTRIPQSAGATPDPSTGNGYTIHPPSQSSVSPPSHAHDQTRKMLILAIFLSLVVLLCVSLITCVLVKLHRHRPDSHKLDGVPPRFMKLPEPETKRDRATDEILPSVGQLSGFASAERRIRQIGRNRPVTVATHNSFHSADANSSVLRVDGASSPGDIARGQSPLSPIDQLTGEFNSALSRAFGSVRISRPFPVSPCVSDSAKSGISSSKQPHQRPEACDGVDVESQCGSIGDAQSLTDELGAATSFHVQDRGSVKSPNSVRSSIADIFRLKHRSPSSKTPQSHYRESISASMDATASSPGFLPTPHADDVNVLFSTSHDSIVIRMPSVPPSSLADSTILLNNDIPHSCMDIPSGLLVNSPSPPRRSNGKIGSSPGSHTKSNALRASLLFDPSFTTLPPASPSSDGAGLIPSTSAGSNMSAQGPHSHAVSDSNGVSFKDQLKSRTEALPSSPPALYSSPSSSITPSPVLLTSLTSESLALAEAIDSLEADVIYASFPSTPSHSSSRSPTLARLRQSPVEKGPITRSPSTLSASKERPLSSSSSECGEFGASMDITCALHEDSESFNEKSGDPKLPAALQTYSLCLGVKESMAQHMTTPSITNGASLDGIDEGLGSPFDDAPRSSATGEQSRTADTTELTPAYTSHGAECFVAVTERSLSASQGHFTIPRVIIQSTSDDDTSKSTPSSKSSSSSSRLAVSVIPVPDETTELIERTMQQIQRRILSCSGSDDGDEEEDDELGSFEGDISLICSPVSRRAVSVHSGDEDDGRASDAYDEASFDGSTHYVVGGEGAAYEPEIDRRLQAVFQDVDAFGYNSNLAYYNYSRPLIPRPSEVAFRAIMNEGRIVEVGHVPRYLDVSKESFVPTAPSPLRASYRASSVYSESGKSRVSDGSMYSQTSETRQISPSWSSVF